MNRLFGTTDAATTGASRLVLGATFALMLAAVLALAIVRGVGS